MFKITTSLCIDYFETCSACFPRNDMPLIQETIPSHLRGGGVGTLVEPAKYEPCETACRMAEGDMSLRTGIKLFVVEIKKHSLVS